MTDSPLVGRLHEPDGSMSTCKACNGCENSNEWEELPVLLQSEDVSDLISEARQRGLSAPALARIILRQFLQRIRGTICEKRLSRSQP